MRRFMNMRAANMLSPSDIVRLTFLRAEAEIQAKRKEGDFIELGVFRGGSAILLAYALKRARSPHILHLLDSWEGLPRPGTQDYGTTVRGGEFRQASKESVERTLRRRRLLRFCKLYKGWFRDTLPHIPGPFSLAHIDCNLYEPAKEALVHVLPKMTKHGVVILDDYGTDERRRFPGVKKAVDECIANTNWQVVLLGGKEDHSAKLIRSS